MFETAKKWYQRDPVKGGEYAISFLEAILTGDISSDDLNIEDALEGYKDGIVRSKNSYDAKVAATEEKYRAIVQMKKNGMTQAAIAKEIGVQPPAVSKMFAKIRSEFPHLLGENDDADQETLGKFPEMSGNIGKNGNVQSFQETLEITGGNEEIFPEEMETLGGNEESGNVSKVSKVSSYNYNYYQNYNQNFSGKTSSIPPVDCVHEQDEDEVKKKIAGFNF